MIRSRRENEMLGAVAPMPWSHLLLLCFEASKYGRGLENIRTLSRVNEATGVWYLRWHREQGCPPSHLCFYR